jgi:hypothetical protein
MDEASIAVGEVFNKKGRLYKAALFRSSWLKLEID